MKSLIILISIVLLIGMVPGVQAQSFTYTGAEIQALLDEVNNSVSTSAGAADAGKMIVLDATGQLDSSLGAGGGGSGDVTVSGTPVANDFARWTDADTIEGRSYSETRSDLSLVIGTNVQAWDTTLDVLGAISFSTNMLTFLAAANYAEMRQQLDLEPNTDFYAPAGDDVLVADGGTGRSTSTTAYGLIAAGTTATGAHQTLAAGATTEILVGGGVAALPAWTTATGTGAPVRAGSPDLTGSPTIGASIDPDTADGAAIGSATKEWSDLYLADGAVIYSQADQSNTMTSSAGGWTFNIFPVTPSADPDADYEVANKKYVDDAVITAGGGDVTGVADCASGACLDGSPDGGTYVRIYDGDSHYGEMQIPNVSENFVITTPSTTSTLLAEDGTGSSLTAVDAITGDSATAFFDAGAVEVEFGGTGAATLTDGGVLLGSGTGAVTPMAVLADSEMIVGDGTTDPVAESGATLRTSIGVGTGDSPQFTGIELSHANLNTLTASGGQLSIEDVDVYQVGGTDVPITDGGTGASDAPTALVNLGISATASEINTPLDGSTVQLAEMQQLQTIDDTTISAGQWVFVGSQDQATYTTSAVTFETVNTGQGAYELYSMDQDVETTDDVSFSSVILTGGQSANGGMEIDNIPNTDETCQGMLTRVTAGQDTITIGMVVGQNTSGKFVAANADKGSTQIEAVGIACETADTDDALVILLDGFYRDETDFDLTGKVGNSEPKLFIVLDDVAGQMILTDGDLLDNSVGSLPATLDDLDQNLGYPWATGTYEVIRFKPEINSELH